MYPGFNIKGLKWRFNILQGLLCTNTLVDLIQISYKYSPEMIQINFLIMHLSCKGINDNEEMNHLSLSLSIFPSTLKDAWKLCRQVSVNAAKFSVLHAVWSLWRKLFAVRWRNIIIRLSNIVFILGSPSCIWNFYLLMLSGMMSLKYLVGWSVSFFKKKYNIICRYMKDGSRIQH
jgi:hypothetical protein